MTDNNGLGAENLPTLDMRFQRRRNRAEISADLATMGIEFTDVTVAGAEATNEMLDRLPHYRIPSDAVAYIDDTIVSSVDSIKVSPSTEANFHNSVLDYTDSGIFVKVGLVNEIPRAQVIIPTKTIKFNHDQLARHLRPENPTPNNATARLALKWTFYMALSELIVELDTTNNPTKADPQEYKGWREEIANLWGIDTRHIETSEAGLNYYTRHIHPHRLAYGMSLDMLKSSPVRPKDRQQIAIAIDRMVAEDKEVLAALTLKQYIEHTYLLSRATPMDLIALQEFGASIKTPKLSIIK